MNIKIGISVCRVCLKAEEGGIKLFQDAFLLENFEFSTQIQVKESDGLPEILCHRCVARLKISCEFKKQSLSSDRYLQAFIQKLNNQINKVATMQELTIEDQDELDLLNEVGYNEKPVETVTEISHVYLKKEYELQELNKNTVEEDSSHIVQKDEGSCDEIEEETEYSEAVEVEEVEEVEELEDDTINTEYQEEESQEEGSQEEGSQEEGSQEEEPESDISPLIKNQKTGRDPLKKMKNKAESNYCVKCKKTFSTRTNLSRHMKIHEGVKPFQCQTCGSRFTQNNSLKQHMLIHTGERPHECKICNQGLAPGKSPKFFRQIDGLKRHMAMKHPEAVGESSCHICSICQRVLRSKYSLYIHTKRHSSPAEVHVCYICDKTFSTKGSLVSHLRLHTGEKLDCNYCDKTFSRKGGLMTHMKLHHGINSFDCNICEKRFAEKRSLVKHLQTHAKNLDQISQCVKCHKSFSIKANLIEHMKSHDLFQCSYCDIAFNTERGLLLHRANEHKDLMKDDNE